ncbi:glycoside hydrolase family 3 N-terminal domain-containing protein [Cereibacter changlensis]|uniref:glycoside hydrolase family 3 N-terminal domain-containing protein n=1 Tax=Cereibacter changlensis TaxID=402884 RepID=UPI0040346FCC
MTAVGRGACIFGCAGPVLLPEEHAFFREADPFGFILFGRNVETPDQLRRLTAELREAVGRDAPVLVDQEGGRVQRLRSPAWREYPPPLDAVRAAGPQAPRMMALRYRLIAEELRAVGIDSNCAPVGDVLTEATHPFLANRCYSDDPAAATELARVVAEAHLAGGVLPVIKHMPGHGRAAGDTHLALPTVSTDLETLLATDFAVFRALNDLPMAMTAHIVFSAVDDRPATCSPPMIRLIRERIGFAGLLMTDDVGMEALSGTKAERAAAAIAAGCDIALHCNGNMDEMTGVAAAAGDMGPEALRRAGAALAARRPPEPVVDIAALEAEHSGLLSGRGHG